MKHALAPIVADDVHGTIIRSVAVVGHSRNVEIELDAFPDLCREIAAEVHLVVVEVARFEHTLLIEIAEAGEVFCLLVATAHANVVLSLGRP